MFCGGGGCKAARRSFVVKSYKKNVRRNVQGVRTREDILKAAGALFARKGFAETSVRDLARESGAGLSTIIYHFNSKENLYLETIRHFTLEMGRLNAHFEPLFAVDVNQPQLVADTLYATIYSFLNACHGENKVEHLIGLYTRLMTERNPTALKMLVDCFADVQQRLPELFSRIRPDFDQVQIGFMQQLLWSLLQYTVVSKQLVLYDMGIEGDDYPAEYLVLAARQFTLYCCLPLGLPAPQV